MKRKRNQQHRETRVWRDPNVVGPQKSDGDQRSTDQPTDALQSDYSNPRTAPTRRERGRIVAATGPSDPRELEREHLLERLLAAEGRPSISHAAAAYADAGFEFPDGQAVWLQLLEHNDEPMILRAIEQLSRLFDEEIPKRPMVLESRLRRIQEFADESATQEAAGNLRRMLANL